VALGFLRPEDIPFNPIGIVPGSGFRLAPFDVTPIPLSQTRQAFDRRGLEVPTLDIPIPGFPISIPLPGSCGPLEACSGPIVAGVCLGSCVPFNSPFVPGPGPAPGPAPLPPAQQQLGGCPPRGNGGAMILCPSGCHPNKSDYFLRSGAFVARGTKCVRNRRRNPLNPRALDRAASRLRSASKAGKFLAKVSVPKGRCR